MTPREQSRLQVLNSLLAEHMTLDQAATVMGVSQRHARRMLTAYRDKGASALTHGLRDQRPHNATAETTKDTVLRLARTRYAGTNHTHLSELLSEREGIDIARTTLRRILVNAGLSSPRMFSVNYYCRFARLVPVHLLFLTSLLSRASAVAGHVKLQDDGVVDHPVNRRGGGAWG